LQARYRLAGIVGARGSGVSFLAIKSIGGAIVSGLRHNAAQILRFVAANAGLACTGNDAALGG
jgi:hypothetical protein